MKITRSHYLHLNISARSRDRVHVNVPTNSKDPGSTVLEFLVWHPSASRILSAPFPPVAVTSLRGPNVYPRSSWSGQCIPLHLEPWMLERL